MFPPFPQEAAHHYCETLIARLDSGSLRLNQIAKPSLERDGHGVMLGSLVCWDKQNQKRVVLYAVSGNYVEITDDKTPVTKHSGSNHTSKNDEIFVPSLVSPDDINLALSEYDAEIHRLTDEINKKTKTLKNFSELQTPKINQNTKNNSSSKETSSQILQIIQKLKQQRTQLTDESLRRVFNLYAFTRWDGKQITLQEIISEHDGKLPPTGTGDCCAPKLLSYAFSHNLQPVSMDEVFYGRDNKNKTNGTSYPPCDERCGYILPSILGLNILYRDSQIIVVNKQSGILSVPGRGQDKQDCIVNRVKSLFPHCIEQPSVHRLDMETSGILILAFTDEAHRNLNHQFENKFVQKKYTALLNGVLERAPGNSAPKHGEQSGHMELPFRLDVENRPHQIYDEENGKIGITDWEKTGSEVYVNPVTGEKIRATRVTFYPRTGRTHQLRLAASDIHGFGLPIIGDSLYGECKLGQKLMLHAFEIEFLHPTSKEKIKITCKD